MLATAMLVPSVRAKQVGRHTLALVALLSAMLVSGGIASAAQVGQFACNIPSIGSITCPGQWNTTGNTPIELFFRNIPFYTYAKAIRCSDNSDISAYTAFDPGIDRNTWKSITPIQPAGICFKLNMNAPTTSSFAVNGDNRY